ncbi:MAG: long-chain fatty acid--CoA ligase [Chloroflexi bacterium]|uniref:acyl-CoA synthetase n=1 Tax=Candidatus Flexifilum breve TaxID=3140694 RepID=UPI0031371F56|nr:long-chain fatty acid--CoA ligase [Chloroflexota bacterium]
METQKSFYVTDWLDRRAKLSPDRIALEEAATGREISYRAWNASANRTANYLRSLGVGRGDRVAVYAANSLDYLDVWMACGKIGAILQNLNWRLTVTELQALLIDAAPLVLIYSDEYAQQVNALRPHVLSVRHFVAFGAKADASDCAFRDRDQQPKLLADRPELVLDDPWVICYTGGTTGLPKGAILTHGNMTWNSINTVVSWGLDEHDVAILNSPLFHTGGLNVFTLPLIHIGGKSIVCKGFDAASVFDLIDQHGVTLYFGVPTMFVVMQAHERWEAADFSRLKLIISGGAPCPLPVFEKFWAKGVDFKTGYGLTEAGPNTFWLPQADVRRKPGAVGFPLFHVDVKVVRPDGSACSASEPGELLIRGGHVTPGYWNNPEATAKTIVAGWLHTGDLASCDDEGYYTSVGRLKDMIIRGGENIYPAEVESVMHAHPAVAEAALIGVPDAKWGEVGRAVIVVKPGQTLTADELIAFLTNRLAKYKVPKTVVFVAELPKTGPGKIDKRQLVEQYGR